MQALMEQQERKYCNVRQILYSINPRSRALKVLKSPIDIWEGIFVYCMTLKLNKVSHQKWEKLIPSTELSNLSQFTNILKTRCPILEAIFTQKDLLDQKGNIILYKK
jgi:hypothetical protein